MNLSQRFLSFTLIFCCFTDLLRKLDIGPISVVGFASVIFAVISWILLFNYSRMPKKVLTVLPLGFFLISTFISSLCHYSALPVGITIQNLSLYLGFVGFLLVSIIQSQRTSELPNYISKILPIAIKISIGLYWLSVLIGGPGTSLLMGARPFALFAVIGVAWFVAAWRYRLPGGLLWSGLTVFAIAFSFSRTATLVAVVLCCLSQLSFNSIKSWLRMGLIITLISIIAFLALTYVEPIRSRFSQVGDNANVGGIQINTAGRNVAWEVAYNSALESPWIGKGAGSVAVVLLKNVGPAFLHPHNDYLRIFHDYGILGLTFWLLGYWQLVVTTFRNWQWADKNDRENAHIHLAAFLALIGSSLVMTTDNVVVYLFVMAPLGILVGCSLGNASRRQKLIKSPYEINLASDNLKQLAVNL